MTIKTFTHPQQETLLTMITMAFMRGDAPGHGQVYNLARRLAEVMHQTCTGWNMTRSQADAVARTYCAIQGIG